MIKKTSVLVLIKSVEILTADVYTELLMCHQKQISCHHI